MRNVEGADGIRQLHSGACMADITERGTVDEDRVNKRCIDNSKKWYRFDLAVAAMSCSKPVVLSSTQRTALMPARQEKKPSEDHNDGKEGES